MVIQVGDSRVYRFDGSTITCDIYKDYAEVVVLPERRKFLLRLKQYLQRAYPERTPQQTLATLIADALRDGFLQVDVEVEYERA